jgi:hypothetical protein
MSIELSESSASMGGMYYPVPFLSSRCLLIPGVRGWEWLELGFLGS